MRKNFVINPPGSVRLNFSPKYFYISSRQRNVEESSGSAERSGHSPPSLPPSLSSLHKPRLKGKLSGGEKARQTVGFGSLGDRSIINISFSNSETVSLKVWSYVWLVLKKNYPH